MKAKRHAQSSDLLLREAELMLGEGKSTVEVAKALEISENTFHRWLNQYGGARPTMRRPEPQGKSTSASAERPLIVRRGNRALSMV